MTSAQHQLLRHCLGVDKRKNPNRNCFATGPDADTFKDIQALVTGGWMYKGASIPGGLTYYHATAAGVALAKLTLEESQLVIFAIAAEIGGGLASAMASEVPVAEAVTQGNSAPWDED